MPSFSMLKALNEYLSSSPLSFHTPGHKGCTETSNSVKLLASSLLKYDLTELPQTGSLFDGEGLTAMAEQAAAKSFKTKGSFMSTGGCTLPIQAMLRLALPTGGKLLCSRSIHRSAVNAMALLGIEPQWFLPDFGNGIFGRANPDIIESALKKNRGLKAVYITSPDYFGVISDVSAISKICGKYNIPLLVDNAHGAHLKYLGGNLHPLQNGAAMSADSAHKTLPVLTGGAWLHINDGKYLSGAREALALFGSTSPSYPIMLSLDLCRIWLEKEGKAAFARLEQKTHRIRTIMKDIGLIFPLGLCDPTRLAADTSAAGINANFLAEHLRSHGIEPEYSDQTSIILIPSPFNSDADFEKLEMALLCEQLDRSHFTAIKTPHLPQIRLSPREAMTAAATTLETAEACGRICAQAVCPCPPGIPIALPGEIIDEVTLKNLLCAGIKNIKVVK